MFNHERLKSLIDRKGISQQQLADAIGVSHVSVYNYVEGKKKPGIRTLQKIANHLKVTTDYLLGVSDSPHLTADQDLQLTKEAQEILQIINDLPEKQRKKALEQLEMFVNYEKTKRNN
ncbi:TPA: helix-turn-helix domain-containing protein [Bacillus thuringiensis]|uniref:Transcriptional regulator n=2 Tax=Bacillus thuringiensis TaxID=1428 RepID=A0A9X6KUL6_BACTU|nr:MULTISPECIES: helix-turn-helix transcriptional regulator [Bacillus]AFQ14942.1 prophage LambdaBa04, DNA-binding protein [Bacillus thuringiensis HD-771]ETE99450.1 XRE family transcriptional regulator [Bacillus thuringiensis serovar aizawai str. Hu4-2]KAB1378303.1 helix-turn-helix transcriptional regulator [Bacillus thuringiensis]KMP95015.1 XRE family transcriptional regulator [Bacillus cereus]KXY12342.1 XRE family transcriptional regulator [Bacillus cereus]